MSAARAILLVSLWALPSAGATFGTIVQHAQPIADLVVDSGRKQLYLVDTATNQVEVYNTASNPPRLSTTIPTDSTPLAAALSRSGKSLYVACYGGSSLVVVDLTSAAFATHSVSLAAPPEALAVGYDEKVLIGTAGTSAGQSVLITYDPNAAGTAALQSITVAPPAPSAPALPPPGGVMALASHSHLQATPDGTIIVGVHELANNTRTVFVYQVASATVLLARNVAAISPVLAVSPDNTRFLSGPILFDAATLLVLAQQSTLTSPFGFPAGASFNTQTTQGGAVFTPDGAQLLAAYDIAPAGAARPNISQLLVNAPGNLSIQLGIQLPENLNAKMAISADGSTIYAISQSGFVVLPMGTLALSPIAMPDTNVALLAFDQCGVFAAQNSAVIPVRNVGGGRITVTAALVTPSATSPQVTSTATSYGANLTPQFNSAAARSLGTATPDQIQVLSPEAVNIPPYIRIYQNFRNPEARGNILPVDIGAGSTGLTDMLADPTRPRLYIANPGLNRIEVFDTQHQQFLAPISVGQLPRSMAFGGDSNTMYVANSGGESIGIVDLTQDAVVGNVQFPALPFNATIAPVTPQVMASSTRGPQVIMSDGTLWKIDNNTVTLRPLEASIFGTAKSITGPAQEMASSPDGSYLLLLAGNGTAYLYSAAADQYITGKQVLNTLITGYFGPVAAGLGGGFFLVDDQLLNQALTSSNGGVASARPVAAVSVVGAQSYARFTMPARASAATAPSDPGEVDLLNAASGQVTATVSALEGPLAAAINGQRTNVAGRTMAVDATGSNAYVLTTSGLSVIPLGSAAGQSPSLSGAAMVNSANFQPAVAAGGLVSIMGRNLASSATAGGSPLPTMLGGTCVTLNGSPLSLLATSAAQINAQLAPGLAAGRYPLVVHSIANQTASGTATITVARYAPAVFVDSDGPAIFHQDGARLDANHPGVRDEPLTIYATGLGPTTGGRVIGGMPSPANPLAVTGKLQVFFGNPTISDSGVIVDWSGLQPGTIGVYQINCRIPGTHLSGDALPVTLRIGGVSSPVTGANVPVVWVR
jgi:uncharacterized protein (TIGR03437 family)